MTTTHKLSKVEFSDLALIDTWTFLSEKTSPHDVGQSFLWNKTWWEYYQCSITSKESWILIEKNVSAELNSIWPFMLRKRHGLRKIHWLGQVDGMITDYCGALFAHDDEKSTLAMLQFMSCNASKWDVIDLFIPQWTKQYQLIINNLIVNEQKLHFNWQTHIAGHSSYICLERSFDVFLASLGKSTRANLRQYLKKIKYIDSRFEILRGKDVLNGLSDLFTLNSENWDVFHGSKECQFHESVVENLTSNSGEFILPRLIINGVVVATILGYESGKSCFLHSAGVKREYIAGISPGMTLHALLIEDLMKRGFSRLDLSPGLEEYKIRLKPIVEPIYRLMIWHPSSRYKIFKLLEVVKFHLTFRSKPLWSDLK